MAATYIVPADLLTFYDRNRVLELVKDDTDGSGDPATESDLSNDASAPYALALNAITTAASMLDSHCQRGKRYTRENLEAVIAEWLAEQTSTAKAKRAALIRQIVADLSFGVLMSRRGFTAQQMREMAPRYEEALVVLEKLAAGEMVFDLEDNVNAGAPSSVQIGLNRYRPSLDNRMFGIWCDQPYVRNNANYFGV